MGSGKKNVCVFSAELCVTGISQTLFSCPHEYVYVLLFVCESETLTQDGSEQNRR